MTFYWGFLSGIVFMGANVLLMLEGITPTVIILLIASVGFLWMVKFEKTLTDYFVKVKR